VRLSDAKSAAKPLDIEFEGGAVLHITYRVPEYTPNQLSALMSGAEKNPLRTAEMVVRTVDSWDLTQDDAEETPIPLTVDAIAEHVTIGIITHIVRSIQADQSPGKAGSSSDDGSPPPAG
jgi:hypothetical protein